MNVEKMKEITIYKVQDEMIDAFIESTEFFPETRTEENFCSFAFYYKYENNLGHYPTPEFID